jgi:hypothetical protein
VEIGKIRSFASSGGTMQFLKIAPEVLLLPGFWFLFSFFFVSYRKHPQFRDGK